MKIPHNAPVPKNNYTTKLVPTALLALVALVGGFEGMKLAAYRDPVGIPTICFGHVKGVKMGDIATAVECDELLKEELLAAERKVDECIKAPLTQNQRIALTSFVYNVGPAGVCGSTLQKKFNAGDYEGGCLQMKKWVYAKGIKLPGLVRRREEESRLCLSK